MDILSQSEGGVALRLLLGSARTLRAAFGRLSRSARMPHALQGPQLSWRKRRVLVHRHA